LSDLEDYVGPSFDGNGLSERLSSHRERGDQRRHKSGGPYGDLLGRVYKYPEQDGHAYRAAQSAAHVSNHIVAETCHSRGVFREPDRLGGAKHPVGRPGMKGALPGCGGRHSHDIEYDADQHDHEKQKEGKSYNWNLLDGRLGK